MEKPLMCRTKTEMEENFFIIIQLHLDNSRAKVIFLGKD